MTFPVSYSGILNINGGDNQAPLENFVSVIEAGIFKRKPKYLKVSENIIEFQGRMGLLHSWNFINNISYGKIDITNSNSDLQIKLYLEFKKFLILCTILILVFVFTVLNLSSNTPTYVVLLICVIGWFWIYGGNYLLSIMFLKSIIRSSIKYS